MKSEINQSLTQDRVPVPDNDRQKWSVEVSCFVSGLLEILRFPAPLVQGLIL